MSAKQYAIWNVITHPLELLSLPSVCDFLCGFLGSRGFMSQKCFYKASFVKPNPKHLLDVYFQGLGERNKQ